MLKLKRIQILGFKSFCDRTEVQLAGNGIAAIVGPNGCGKSNISDAITWVLGEQSAKSLRGTKMEDVIFAGTRDRKPTGMAEVSLTLVDPEVYDGHLLAPGETPEIEIEDEHPEDNGAIKPNGDWDEAALRAERAADTEAAVLEAQPGQVIDGEAHPQQQLEGIPEADAANNVVLKIRRRKFNRAPVRAGEITVTRRLFRSGESEYLMNGKICRLRDIQDVFMGTGLSGENYAIIGQERIGQLLSSKPLDRRAILEEAAGVTRFKTKKRLAELRLEAAKQNLARVNDIFDEVTRQMASLKRQAAKAERYVALRDELRTKLRVVLASKLAQMDAEQANTAQQIASLTETIDSQAAEFETLDAEASTGRARGYELDAAIREAGVRSNQTAVELERVVARTASNTDRISELETRLETGNAELAQIRQQMETLAAERAETQSFLESATAEAAGAQLESKRSEESETKRRGDQLRAEVATLLGRRNSLEALIREHSYSTDTVRNIFRHNAATSTVAPIGTLADFLEVDGQYEQVVDEFLRDELNYIVVKSWDAADQGMQMLRSDVEGRATFLVHPPDSQARFPFTAGMESTANTTGHTGIVPLKNCIRVLNGFGKSLEVVLPKLREGYVTPDSSTARDLALQNPDAFFLSPSGETFHNVTVTGGRPRGEGPLALKRELREIQTKLEGLEAELSQTEIHAATLARQITELSQLLEHKQAERREAERESANQGAALRQMESEAARIERRLAEWQLSVERNREARNAKQDLISRKQEEAAKYEAERASAEGRIAEFTARMDELRLSREVLQSEAAAASAQLAGLEERRRNATAAFEQNQRMFNGQQQRLLQMEQQLTSGATEKQRREEENLQLAEQQTVLAAQREQAISEQQTLTSEATALRASLTELEQKLKTLRIETDALREKRSALTAQAARLSSDIEHLEAQTMADLGVEAAELRADELTLRISGDELTAAGEETGNLKQKLENMGPVNMMALEEFAETEQRHGFLESQRKDLLDSIENTHQSIKEIDEVSRTKFEEAFTQINENFSTTFTKLFNGGQAMMKLTDPDNISESGIDIIASPPGKKLQNILLLSGGEKALTAFSLLVGIFLYAPAPFCILDEVDAPLDETNVGRFAKLVSEMSANTQFVVITHHKRTMSEADMIYGVTMQEPGVSRIVSVNLNRADRTTNAA
ncbi:AAA family ATPase [Terriglobus sp. YAF25]|uniref:AAA family ATPase n=1 Tax=Terriglobus sp. YAF25 TaxID=3233080 RepID=UPI003F96FA5C